MKRVATVLFLCLAIMLGSSAEAASSATLSRIVDRGSLRVGMSGSQPPFVMMNRDGEMVGFEVDLAHALANAMGVKLEIVTTPFAKLLPALKSGDVDMVMSGMTMTPERNMKFAFVGPYFVSGKSILTSSAALAEADETEDLDKEELTLVALEGSTSQAFVEIALPKAKLALAPDYDAAVKMVLEGKAVALVADRPICVVTLLQHPNKGLITNSTPLTLEPIGVALPPNDPLLVNFMVNVLGALEDTGVIEALSLYWFENASWLAELP